MNSASLCSLAGRYDNLIPTRCLAPIDFLKIPAQYNLNPFEFPFCLLSPTFSSSSILRFSYSTRCPPPFPPPTFSASSSNVFPPISIQYYPFPFEFPFCLLSPPFSSYSNLIFPSSRYPPPSSSFSSLLSPLLLYPFSILLLYCTLFSISYPPHPLYVHFPESGYIPLSFFTFAPPPFPIYK